jgi:hypothetical protein
MAAELYNIRGTPDIPLSLAEQLKDAVDNLPHLDPSEISLDESCPICLLTFKSIVGDPEERLLLNHKSSELVVSGITKIEGCGHIFCRQE